MESRLREARTAHTRAIERLENINTRLQSASGAETRTLAEEFNRAKRDADNAAETVDRLVSINEARRVLPVVEDDGPPSGNGHPGRPTRGLLRSARVIRDEAVYRPDGEHGFFRDVFLAQARQDLAAMRRLELHNQMALGEQRDVTSGDPGAGGFIPPMYLADQWIELPRPKRPLADVVPKLPLAAEGMTMSFPRVQSGTSVDVQATENTAVSETDLDSETYQVPVRTIAGVNDVSIQALERSQPGFDEVTFRDLIRAYDARLDVQLLSGSGSSGQHMGLRNVSGIIPVTWTSGTPTGKGFLNNVYEAASLVATQAFTQATHLVAHPRRLAWLASQTLSNEQHILHQGNLPTAQVGQQDKGFATAISGLIPVSDPNIAVNLGAGTNEDEVYVVAMDELMLAEGQLVTEVFRSIGGATETLTARLRLYAYSAAALGRVVKGIARISGTGLVTPAFAD